MPAAELGDKAAQAMVLKRIGNPPQGVTVGDTAHQTWSDAWNNAFRAVQAEYADMMRCVYGNPFHPVSFAPNWFTPAAKTLAAGLYYNRDFVRLPKLADSLEEAGCKNLDI